MKMRKEKALKCSATSCSSRNANEDDGITLFSFPTDDRIRCRQWVTNTGREDLRKRSSKSLISFHLCCRHFKDDQFSNDQKTALIANAIPTIFYVDSDVNAPGDQLEPSPKQVDKLGDKDKDENDKQLVGDSRNSPSSSFCLSQKEKKSNANQKSMYKSGNTHCQWCSAINCSNNRIRRPDLSFFRFPVDPERCKKWIMNSQRFDLKDKSSKNLHNGSYIICSEHFEERCIRDSSNSKGRQRLFNWAVPTIFNFTVSKTQRKSRKPTPTFPSVSSHNRAGNIDRVRRISNSTGTGVDNGNGRQKTRSLKRSRETVKPEPEDCMTKSSKMESLKELKKENLCLSDQLFQLTQSRVQMMKRLEELEAQMDLVKEHSRIDVELLNLALDTSKHQNAEQEFKRLRSVVKLLAEEEEVGNHSGGEDTMSCESLE